MKVDIKITNSKVMSYALLAAAIYLDISGDRSGTVFMYTVPFIAAMIGGKQYLDRNKKQE